MMNQVAEAAIAKAAYLFETFGEREYPLTDAIGMGMIDIDKLGHLKTYIGYSPRNIHFATWDNNSQVFFLRVVENGDIKFRRASYPSDPKHMENVFVPTALAEFSAVVLPPPPEELA